MGDAAEDAHEWLTPIQVRMRYKLGRSTVYARIANEWAPFVLRIGRKVSLPVLDGQRWQQMPEAHG